MKIVHHNACVEQFVLVEANAKLPEIYLQSHLCAWGLLNSFELSDFRARRQSISAQISLLIQIATDLNLEAVAAELEKTNNDMAAEVFRFVVVGEFSRGKSTVINALLGDKVLPSSVEPTTTVLTKIVGGQNTAFRLVHRDDRADLEITRDQFRALTAPPEPGQRDREQRRRYEERLIELRSLSMVEVSTPAQICQAGVEIVDTPGTNDLDPLREQITYDYIPRADAILFVLTARMGLSQSESDFLQNRVLKTDVARVFFLLNYADTLTPGDLSTVEKKCLSDLSGLVGQPRLFPVSARQALSSRMGSGAPAHSVVDGGFGELEKALASFLEKDRAGAKLKRPISRALRICEDLLAGPVAIAIATVGMELPLLQRKVEELTPQIQQLQQRRDLTLAALRLRLDNRRSGLIIVMREGLYEIATAALDAVDKYEGPLGTDELNRHIEARVAPVQSRFQTSFKVAASEAFSEEFSKVEKDFARIQGDLDALFKGSLLTAKFECQVPSLGSTGWTVLQAGGAGIGLIFLPFFAPIALAAGWLGGAFIADLWQTGIRREKQGEIRNAVDERYRATIPASILEFERNWQEAGRLVIAELTHTFDQRCDEARIALQSALDNLLTASATAAEIRATMDVIESRIRSVQESLSQEESPL
jgi:GTPase SAR1 family protein